MNNDLLRILATPELYEPLKNALENYALTFDKVMNYEDEIM